MGELFPLDLPDLFTSAVLESNRPPDGKLHASSDLNGSLRHVQLRALGIPTKPRPVASTIRLMTGTLWHEWFHKTLIENQIPFFHELKLDPYLHPGWGGTADWVFWHPEYEAFILGDLKTARGEGMFWINRDGAKEEHIWQLSAYFHALLNMGLPMVNAVGVMYWPMNDTSDGESPKPSLQEVKPLPRDVVWERMAERAESVDELREQVVSRGVELDANGLVINPDSPGLDEILDGYLAPEQDRVQKLVWNKNRKVHDVVLVPHWSARFCDWDEPHCGCSNQGQTKIGEYDLDGDYTPRRDYDHVQPDIRPSERDLSRRRKEINGSSD